MFPHNKNLEELNQEDAPWLLPFVQAVGISVPENVLLTVINGEFLREIH